MLKEARQKAIVEYIYKYGQVNVNTLCDVFSVSHDTIRRDLLELEDLGEIKRVFGGAIPQQRIFPDYQQRIHDNQKEKVEIARKALSLLKNDQLIVLDGGTTNTIFASMIPHTLSLTIVTNSFPIAMELKNHKNIKTIILGGDFFPLPMVMGGSVACEQMLGFHADLLFLGVDSIHPDYGVSIPYYEEINIKKTMCRQAKKIVCLCTSKKMARKNKYRICTLEEVDVIVSDSRLDENVKKTYPINKIL